MACRFDHACFKHLIQDIFFCLPSGERWTTWRLSDRFGVTGVDVMSQYTAIPQIHGTCSKCVAMTANECGKAALM